MDAFLIRLKAAQFDLIEACGGIDRAGDKAGYGKSTVGRWNDRYDPSLMPLTAIAKLEADCGQPFVTEVMASVTGRRLTDPEARPDCSADILVAHAHVRVSEASLGLAVAEAIADGQVTPAEAAEIDREAAALDRATDTLRAKIASIRARHGEKSGLKIVGGDAP
ncbi:hypothetical protein J2046_000234 [Rhizobium petrolearium]|uniref:hypothetical protein n=1 Tax=Neorhizobium petrolearium TaxID=515361 RepID=UPI001AE8C41B|nr:hypothetical protein [Neorhizobium petrolearium]MBP1841990.1 hypothetical protein [Neorhizobium petrolearium]